MTHPYGIGFQLNFYTASLLRDLERIGAPIDYLEMLCDTVGGSMDGPHVIDPRQRASFEETLSKYKVVAHSNYGEQYGFKPLRETPFVARHIPIAQEMKSPWIADHMFYGTPSTSYLWSTPLQFSNAEIERVRERAAAMQDLLKMPLLHENAFIYALFPGSDIQEAEFLAGVAEKAGTHLLVDLHNIHANSVNFEGYDPWAFLRTIPLDKVIEVHLAGGQWIDDWYHDLHNSSVPEPVWQMLEFLLKNAPNIRGVCLEVQGPLHNPMSRPIDDTWAEMAKADLTRARVMWNANHASSPL